MTALFSLLLALLIPIDETGYRNLLKTHHGKVVLVDFWATWCAPCRAEMPVLAGLEKKWRDKGLVLVTISADEPEQEADAYKFLERNAIRRPVYLKRAKDDEQFINMIYKKWSGALPALFLYDRNGNLERTFIGETEPSAIEAAIRQLL